MITEKFGLCRRMFPIHSSPIDHLMTPLIYLVTLLGGPDPRVGNHWTTILLYAAASRFLFNGTKKDPDQEKQNQNKCIQTMWSGASTYFRPWLWSYFTFYDRLLIFEKSTESLTEVPQVSNFASTFILVVQFLVWFETIQNAFPWKQRTAFHTDRWAEQQPLYRYTI